MDLFSEEDVCKLFDEEETNNTTTTTNNDITILFSVNQKTNNALAKIQCLPNGFNLNGKRSPSNTTHNVFVSDQLKVQLFNPLVVDDDSSLVCQLFINETLHTEKTFNELHECNLTIPRCNKGGSQGKSRVGYLKLVIQKQGEQNKLVGLSNNFWIRTKTRKETVTNDKKIVEDKKLKKREYEEDSESSYSSDSKRKKQPITDNIEVISQGIPINCLATNLVEENQELKKRIAELEKLVSDIITGKVQGDQNLNGLTQPIIQTSKISKPRPSPLMTSNTFGMCSPTSMMTSSCTSPGLDLSPTYFTSPVRTGFENMDFSSNYSFDDMGDFF